MDNEGVHQLTRQMSLKKSFRLGIQASLAACSKEDFRKAFSSFSPKEQEYIHQFFTQVASSIHECIEKDFEDICREKEVEKVLDTVELLVEEHRLEPLKSNASEEVLKHLLEIKKFEVNRLMGMVEQAEERKQLISSRIDFLKNEKVDLSGAIDLVEKLRSLTSSNTTCN
ncbi:unnamed protein product [Cuscuta europaea]|nr:unnamed protein product [Cuscuta europaea]